MAKNNSYLKFEGSLGGLTYYEKNGDSFVKTQSRISRNRIFNDPAFKRTRENMQEFGGAARAGKAFRSAFGGAGRSMSDTYMGNRATTLMKRIITTGTGVRGERELDLVNNEALFNGFEFNKEVPFSSVFLAPFEEPTVAVSRDEVTWTVPDFDTDAFVRKPEGATHFRLVLTAGAVSDYAFQPLQKSYEPVNEAANGIGDTAYSADIALGGIVGSNTVLTAQIILPALMPATTAVFGATGIIFYQEVNGVMYELAQRNCMQVAVAG